MQAFNAFSHMPPSFWPFVKFISEQLGYTERGQNLVKSYSEDDLLNLCYKFTIPTDYTLVKASVEYTTNRAALLNNYAATNFMNVEIAQSEFYKLHNRYIKEQLMCKLPRNKQPGEKSNIAFFTAMINILTELTIREKLDSFVPPGFDDDPRKLIYMCDQNGNITGTASRRFDGAYPSTISPKIVWEIKEYYYTTTFGSRIADGVYETLLDGFELNQIYQRTGQKIVHILFIDAYDTWWNDGKSYLCRIVDALNMGLVDEVLVGREIFTRWQPLLRSLLN